MTAAGNPETAAAKLADVRARSGLGSMDCKNALSMFEGDADKAVSWLAEGHWKASKLISWDYQALDTHSWQLHEQTGRPEAECRRTLMNAGGNADIAKQRLIAVGRD